MYNGNGTRLVGDDGALYKAAFGAIITGSGAVPLPVGTYLVTAVAAVSGLPAPAEGGDAAAAGDVITVVAGQSITPAVGDNLVTLALTQVMDISSWKMDFTKEEIDTTVLADAIKKYRAGKADMQGAISGLFVTGTTDSETGFLRQFINIKKQDGDLSFDSFAQEESILVGFFYTNKNNANGADKMLVIAPFQIFGNSVGGEMGSAQSYSTNFRFATYSYLTTAIEPSYYRLGDGQS